ncbi:hypothetical protein [Brachybacterium sp. YJGR34]|uniref:hypothetical protein n=1 Tax=Brachybacterium sp. YJGR34 TaxID=2059911 RepID=UPI001E460E47|nr:hypothetical protein [Brachybacterium sp. YJGR34]
MRALLFPALPLARVQVMRVIVYAMVALDVLTLSSDVLSHARNPGYYAPVLFARWLHLPAVTPLVAYTLLALILGGCAVALAGRRPRAAGAVVAVAFTLWMLYSNSYGYVAHDHLALMVAVAVLPTVPLPRTDGRGDGPDASSEAAGWALRAIQIAVVCTYFFSVIPKILYSGSLAAWGNSAILTWASIRRGSVVAHWLVETMPWIFVPAQWAGLALELLSPVVLLLRGRALYVAVALYLGFHLATLVLLGIHFLPTVVCWAAFLPLERLPVALRRRVSGRSRRR